MQLLLKITNHSNATNNECCCIGRFKNIKNVMPNTNMSSRQSLSSTTNASFCYSAATGESAQQSKLFNERNNNSKNNNKLEKLRTRMCEQACKS